MSDKKMGVSLKYKLLLLLTTIPVVSLAIYIAIATRLFESDKIAYVKDSSVAVARSLATQFRLEIGSFVDHVRPILDGYDFNEMRFTESASDLFKKFERADALVILQKSSAGTYVKLGELTKDNAFAKQFIADESLQGRARELVLGSGLTIIKPQFSEMHLVVATLIGQATEVHHIVALGLYRASDLQGAFTKAHIYDHFLIDRNGMILLSPPKAELASETIKMILQSAAPEGAIDLAGEKPQIVSYAESGVAGMRITAIVDRREALSAVNALLIQSLLFFVALIATTVIISVVSAVKLTSALRELYEATKLIAKGQFDVRIKKQSNDEVGGLAEGFNFMAGEVSRLMLETADKARMAGELETVKIVQETLFPAEQYRVGPYHVVGHFEPASECGGDWWNYSLIENKLYLWIGDATGHGAPAAMVTSAAKSAATIIEDMPGISPGKALEILNKAIHETSKGRILMTFFIACVDTKTGELTYANASHEPPYLIRPRKDGKPITKKDLEPLVDASGTRLGDKKGAKYAEAKTQINAGDTILFYTDGIVDLMNKDGKAWGERGFVKSICDSTQAGSSVDERMMRLRTNITEYRQETELVDDITLLMCQYKDVA